MALTDEIIAKKFWGGGGTLLTVILLKLTIPELLGCLLPPTGHKYCD